MADPRDFELSIDSVPSSDIHVVSFTGREVVNGQYRFDVKVLSRSDALSPESIIGKPVRLTMNGPDAARYVHGVVDRAAPLTVIRGETSFSLRIVPRVSFLRRRKTSRIYQDKNVVEIVSSIVKEIGAHVELRLGRDYAKRPYCVQYQETDYEFVRRLLAEEGIFYFFQHAPPADAQAPAAASGRETMVLADAALAYADIDGSPAIRYRERGGLLSGESVFAFVLEQRVREGSALVRGFDYEKPNFVPVGQANSSASANGFDASALRTYDHDRVLEPQTVGAHVAPLRVEELRAKASMARGESSCPRLVPGARFHLEEHPFEAHSGQYVVYEVSHHGRDPRHADNVKTGPSALASQQETYGNAFRCAPAKVALRPKRQPRKLLQVTETATVVGPQNEEIHTDEMGRIKIQFHWDLEGQNDDKSSCWVRVMQGWAGTSWGAQFIPRVGMEAVVSFTGGDPDRPIVLGCVYNGLTPPPFPVPSEKTKSGFKTRSSPGGGGFNQLSFDDAAGAEEIYLHAERDFNEVVEKDHTSTVYGKEVVNVKESRLVDVAQDNIRVVRGSEYLIVEKNLVLNVAGHKLIQVGSPPAQEEREEESRQLPDSGSPYAKFNALASLPMFDDAAAAKAGQIRRAKILWQAEQLEGDSYQQGQALSGRVREVDSGVDGLAGATHLLTQDIAALPAKVYEGKDQGELLDEAISRTEVLLERGRGLVDKIEATLGQPPANEDLAKMHGAVAEHLTPQLARTKDLLARLDVYQALLAEPEELFAGGGGGGGGGGEPTAQPFKTAPVAFNEYNDEKGNKVAPSKTNGSQMDILNGPGLINAPEGFKIQTGGSTIEMLTGVIKIKCGGSEIELTPGSISIKSGVVKINGGPDVLING